MTRELLQIPKQFKLEKGTYLFSVIGKKIGIFYLAIGQKISKIFEIEEEIPKYSDKEGFFVHSGKGQRYGSGSVYESKEEEVKKRFSKKVSESVNKILKEQKIDTVYIIGPDYMKNMIISYLNKNILEKIVLIKGNYVKKDPISIVKRVKGFNNA